MARSSSIQKNKKRIKLEQKTRSKRNRLKEIVGNKELPLGERMEAQFKLNELPRNSAPCRIRNRCEITGRPRGYYRKFRMCRNKLRELGSFGQIPGLVKSSW